MYEVKTSGLLEAISMGCVRRGSGSFSTKDNFSLKITKHNFSKKKKRKLQVCLISRSRSFPVELESVLLGHLPIENRTEMP